MLLAKMSDLDFGLRNKNSLAYLPFREKKRQFRKLLFLSTLVAINYTDEINKNN